MKPKTNRFKDFFISNDTIYVYLGFYLYFVAASCAALWMLFAPQAISYSYSSFTACTTSPKVLPALFNRDNRNFEVTRPKTLSVLGYPLYSHTLCVAPKNTPTARSAYTTHEALPGFRSFGKPIHIKSAAYARVVPLVDPAQAVPVDKPLRFRLDKPDTTFGYIVKVNRHQGSCALKDRELSCDISKLSLEHAHTYDVTIARTFNSKPVDQAKTIQTKTLTPISITASSITGGALVYDEPSQLKLETDKQIKDLGKLTLVAKDSAGTEAAVAVKATAKDKTITVSFAKPLPRKTTFEIQIDSLHAVDDSGLSSPYRLSFSTSGGPKVTGTNIGKYNVSASQTITVQFDQPLDASQGFSKLVTLKVGGQVQPAAISSNGSTLTINPTSDMPACGAISLSLTADIQSNYQISGDSAWSYTSRVRCAVAFSIGTSVKGRAITAYRFGSGANPVTYVGTIHGNETSAKSLMENWLNELEANADQIPAGRSIIVIPVTNPDGVAANQRINANNVDLNRNFPSNDWKSAVTVPGGNLLQTGGGVTALSEPETQALANFVQQQRPRVLLTFHAKASLIEANESGDSMALATLYAKTSRYRAIAKSQNTVFNYDTTGALEDWMHDKLGLPALCIELSSQTGNEFSRNKAALWALAKI